MANPEQEVESVGLTLRIDMLPVTMGLSLVEVLRDAVNPGQVDDSQTKT